MYQSHSNNVIKKKETYKEVKKKLEWKKKLEGHLTRYPMK